MSSTLMEYSPAFFRVPWLSFWRREGASLCGPASKLMFFRTNEFLILVFVYWKLEDVLLRCIGIFRWVIIDPWSPHHYPEMSMLPPAFPPQPSWANTKVLNLARLAQALHPGHCVAGGVGQSLSGWPHRHTQTGFSHHRLHSLACWGFRQLAVRQHREIIGLFSSRSEISNVFYNSDSEHWLLVTDQYLTGDSFTG